MSELTHDRKKGGLSPAEQRVYDLAVQGLSYKEIAAKLWISWRTVITHLQNIRKKGVNLPNLWEIRRSNPVLHEQNNFRIGSLCSKKHRYNDTDQSLRHITTGACVECVRLYIQKRTKKQRRLIDAKPESSRAASV